MSIVNVHNLKKAFGTNVILHGISFQLHIRERVGLVGPNGAGKTTILNIMTGFESIDEGIVSMAKGSTLGYLHQSSMETATGTMEEELRQAFVQINQLGERMLQLEQQMAIDSQHADELEKIMVAYGELRHRFEEAEGYSAEARLRAVVNGLGFAMDDLSRPVSTFSGGERTRLRLARLLLEKPDVLLLDEPTNHLDISAVEWLEKFLGDWSGTVLIVSHDRYFLDRVVGRILALENGMIKSYSGNYSAYIAQKELELVTQKKSYHKQQNYIEKEATYIRTSGTGEREKRQAKSRQKRLDKLEAVDKPRDEKSMVLDFTYSGRSGDIVARLEHVTKIFEEHTVFSDVDFQLRWGDRVALVGPNGSGKSPLLKLIAGEIQADTGVVWVGPSVQPVYFDQHQQALALEKTPLAEIIDASTMTTTEARTYLGHFLFSGDDVFKRNADLSGGEKSRLALAKLGMDDGNFLILDEPTSHLDIQGVEELEAAILSFPGTLIVVSHDRYFLTRTTTKVLDVTGGKVKLYSMAYEKYVEAREIEAIQQQSPGVEDRRQRQEEERVRREEKLLLRRKRRKLQLQVTDIEAEIARLEDMIAILEAQLADQQVFSDYKVAAEKGQEMNELKSGVHTLIEQWEMLTEELESFPEEE